MSSSSPSKLSTIDEDDLLSLQMPVEKLIKRHLSSQDSSPVLCVSRQQYAISSVGVSHVPSICFTVVKEWVGSIRSLASFVALAAIITSDIGISFSGRVFICCFGVFGGIVYLQNTQHRANQVPLQLLQQERANRPRKNAEDAPVESNQPASILDVAADTENKSHYLMQDCVVVVMEVKLNLVYYTHTKDSTAAELAAAMICHIQITHTPTNAKWNMWRTMSDLYLIRGAIESHIHAHEDDTQETSGRPSSDEAPGRSTSSGTHKGLSRVTSMLSRKPSQNNTRGKIAAPGSPPTLPTGKKSHKYQDKHGASNSAGQNRRHAADVLTVVDAVTTPTLPTLPILIPTQALDNMDTFLQRKQIQIAAWLWSMQDMMELANEVLFRELLGLPRYAPPSSAVVDPGAVPGDVAAVGGIERAASPPLPATTKNYTGDTTDTLKFNDHKPGFKNVYLTCKDSHGMNVRGRNYMRDSKKTPAGSCICECILMEIYEVEPGSREPGRHDHIASRGACRKRVEVISSMPDKPFVFVINFQMPGDPPVSMVAYFALPSDYMERYKDMENMEGFKKLLDQFIDLPRTEEERLAAWGVAADGASEVIQQQAAAAREAQKLDKSWSMPSDITWPEPHEPGSWPQSDFRNKRYKLIPMMLEGPWAVMAAVRSKPAMLGQKIVQRYFRGDNYMEVDMFVGSSIIADQIVGVCRGYGKLFSCNVAVVIQGECEQELPEKVLMCFTINKVDIHGAKRSLEEELDEEEIVVASEEDSELEVQPADPPAVDGV